LKRKSITLQKAEYSALFNKSHHFVCRAFFCRYEPVGNSKIGWIIPKKKIKRAVDRNTLKRIFREHFRQNYNELQGLHILISIRYPIKEFKKPDFHEQTRLCFKQLIKYAKELCSSSSKDIAL
jgi:ribonuclease P protein component